ncbi:hypothetical protein IJT93_06340 [bacterium]|nr:hypothetical protein [bacterium]
MFAKILRLTAQDDRVEQAQDDRVELARDNRLTAKAQPQRQLKYKLDRDGS